MFTVLMQEIKDRKNVQRTICQYIPKDTSMENIVKDYLFLFWSVFRAKTPVDVTDERTALARSMVTFFKDLAKEFESDPQILDLIKRAVKVKKKMKERNKRNESICLLKNAYFFLSSFKM